MITCDCFRFLFAKNFIYKIFLDIFYPLYYAIFIQVDQRIPKKSASPDPIRHALNDLITEK